MCLCEAKCQGGHRTTLEELTSLKKVSRDMGYRSESFTISRDMGPISAQG